MGVGCEIRKTTRVLIRGQALPQLLPLAHKHRVVPSLPTSFPLPHTHTKQEIADTEVTLL